PQDHHAGCRPGSDEESPADENSAAGRQQTVKSLTDALPGRFDIRGGPPLVSICLWRVVYGQCQASSAANGSDSGTTVCTACVLRESASAPASDTTVPAITLPPNTSCFGLSKRLK